MPAPKIGEPIQNFTLPDQDGDTVNLTDFAGKPVILFFYPKADTPGCTIEACGFRDQFNQLQKAGAVLLGISRDTVKSQKKFQLKYGINYPLLADADQAVCRYFEVIKPKSMYGKLVTGIERTTFVIGPDQRLLHVFPKVKPEGHAEEVLALLRNM